MFLPKKVASLTRQELEEAYQTALDMIDMLERLLKEEEEKCDLLLYSFDELYMDVYG